MDFYNNSFMAPPFISRTNKKTKTKNISHSYPNKQNINTTIRQQSKTFMKHTFCIND